MNELVRAIRQEDGEFLYRIGSWKKVDFEIVSGPNRGQERLLNMAVSFPPSKRLRFNEQLKGLLPDKIYEDPGPRGRDKDVVHKRFAEDLKVALEKNLYEVSIIEDRFIENIVSTVDLYSPPWH